MKATLSSGAGSRLIMSVIVISLNEGSYLARTIECLRRTLPHDAELIIVDDGSTDGSTAFLEDPEFPVKLVRSHHLGVAAARNRGASVARGDVLIFADAHIDVPPAWWQPLLDRLEDETVGAVAPAMYDMNRPRAIGYGLYFTGPDLTTKWWSRPGETAGEALILPGACLAMRRDTFAAVGGFDAGMIRWGGVDNELGVRLWLLGYRLCVLPEVAVAHLFRAKGPYPQTWSNVLHNRLRLAYLHFDEPRRERVRAALQESPHFPEAAELLNASNVHAQRAEWMRRRRYDEHWLCQRFAVGW